MNTPGKHTEGSAPRVLLSAFQFNPTGVSEGYLAARWFNSLSHHCQIDLVSAEAKPGERVFRPSSKWNPRNGLLRRLNSTFKFDYFTFNRRSEELLREAVRNYDILHHIAPQAPRYPVSLSRYAKRFVIGPVGGGLRVPPAFRKEVEGSEEFFFKARAFDAWRLKHDKALIRTFESAAAIVVAGDYVRDVLPERFHGRFHPMLDVGVDVASYSFHQRRREDDVLKLVFVGRVVPYKGLIYLLEALSRLPEGERRKVHLSVAGNRDETDYEKECRRFVASERMEEMVSFLGYLRREEINQLLAESHVFCFPSLAEAGGAAVIEALATGLPVIAADLGGPGESVSQDCGAKVEARSPKQLVEGLLGAISSFADGSRSLEDASTAARRRAEDLFDWRVKAIRMLEIYRGIS